MDKAIEKLKDKEISAFYTKSHDDKYKFVNFLIEYKKNTVGLKRTVYFCPKKFKELAQANLIGEVYIFCYEDIQKTNIPYDLASKETFLILEDCARYKNIISYIFTRLAKLTSLFKHKTIIDVIPFTTSIEYLYVPWSFLSRTILEHQHWYAFRENNLEMTQSGEQVRGLDYTLLSNKIKDYCAITYDSFFSNATETLHIPLTTDEKIAYQERRDHLFQEQEKKSGSDGHSPIVTKLADFTNMLESRYLALENLINRLEGQTIVYTNIKSHNAPLKKRLKNVPIHTYYDVNGEESNTDHIVLFEVPIVRSYLFLDVLANLKPSCKVWIFNSDTTVDRFLYKRMSEEYAAINEFTKVLWSVMQ